MKNITTIKISKETKDRLNKLKEHERETYDVILKKILYILNIVRKDSEKAEKILENIDIGIRRREKYTRVYPKEEKRKE